MKSSTTFKLFSGVCILGVAIWIMDKSVDSTAVRKDRSSRVLSLGSEKITGLYIEHGELKIECAKIDGTWQIKSPIAALADSSAIERVISLLERMPCSEVITASQRTDRALGLGDYGLLFPETRFVIRHPLGADEVLLGKESPVGGLVYLKLKSSSDVIGTDKVILDAVPESVTKLRERVVLHGDSARTQRIEIHRRDGGFVQLVNSSGKWMMKQPVVARADSGKIAHLLDVLYDLNVVDFVWDPAVQSEKPVVEADAKPDSVARSEMMGLTEAESAARITVWTDGDEVGKELILGKIPEDKKGEVYVKRRDADSLYTVNSGMLNLLSVPVNEFRDKSVFAMDAKDASYLSFSAGDVKLVLERDEKLGWQISEPVRWTADHEMVEGVVEELARLNVGTFMDVPYTNLSAYGLADPACSLVLCKKPPRHENGKAENSSAEDIVEKKNDSNGALLVGDIGLRDEGRLYVLMDYSGPPKNPADASVTVGAIFSPELGKLIANPVDPLTYRDRTILSVSPKSVRKISLLKDGKENSVSRGEGEKWTIDGTSSNAVNYRAVSDVMFYTANLRALRIESHNPKSLASYGLDELKTKLTLGLDGAEGIQKTLILGFRAKSDGVYAMVQGQDVVFVLGNDIVAQLTANLVAPAPVVKDKKAVELGDGTNVKD